MFPLEYQVNVHHHTGEIHQYTLLENQSERHLIVILPSMVQEMLAYVNRGGQTDDGLVALLSDEVVVLDRRKGTLLALEEATRVMAKSKYAALQRAALLRLPLPDSQLPLSGEDLAWAFGLEVARRKHAA